MKFSAVILAGGKSRRMGRDKAWLEIGGQTLLARQIGLARETGAVEVFISGREGTDYSAFGDRVLLDQYPDAGPLAGIECAFAVAQTSLLLVLAVDLPAISAKFLQRLAAGGSEAGGAVPKLAGRIEPLAAFYPKASQPLAATLLRAGDNAVANFAEHCVQSGLARFVDLPAAEAKYFINWNSPADFASTAVSR